MVKVGLVLVGCISLSGCATLSLMSFGASSISYVVTGKSISDHAISTVMKQDCALHRSVLGEQTCVEYDGDGILRGQKPGQQSDRPVVAAYEDNWQITAKTAPMPLYNLPPTNQPIKSQPTNNQKINNPIVKTSVSPHQTVLQLMVEQQPQPIDVADEIIDSQHKPSSGFIDEPALYAVVGSYNQRQYAENNLVKQKRIDNDAHIMTNPRQLVASGATRYRVVIGPLKPSEFNQQLGDVGERANHQAWRLTLCRNTLLPPPCEGALLAKQ